MAERWSDDRLDELGRKVGRLDEVVTDVAVLKSEFKNLARELHRNTDATEHVAEQLEQAKIEPLTRGRALRNQIVIAVIGAIIAGVFVILGVILSKA